MEFEYELDLFGEEYKQLKLKYQPILQPSNGPNPMIGDFHSELFLSMRRELGKLRVGDKVLSRWPDDGWYYPSVVRDYKRSRDDNDESRYKVENKLGAVKFVFREDLIHQIPENQAELKVHY